MGVPATYVQATPDLMMGDLLKNMRSQPDLQRLRSAGREACQRASKPARSKGEAPQPYQVELLGLDVFDPVTMEPDHREGDDVPAWFLDTDYNGLCFHVSPGVLPAHRRLGQPQEARCAASTTTAVWDHLAGTISAPFEAGEHGRSP